MKPSNLAVLMASILLMAVGVGRADHPTTMENIPHEREYYFLDGGPSKPFYIYESTPPIKYPDWTVVKGTEAIPLAEFIESGKLCEFRGWHEWEVPSIFNRWVGTPCGEQDQSDSPGAIMMSYHQGQWCKLCHHCRHRIKVQKESEEWEQ